MVPTAKHIPSLLMRVLSRLSLIASRVLVLLLALELGACDTASDAADGAAGSGAACSNFRITVPIESNARTDLVPNQPDIGTACGGGGGATISGDNACVLILRNGTQDSTQFCHPKLAVCVRPCARNSNCPPTWVCDSRAATQADANGRSFCVKPDCK